MPSVSSGLVAVPCCHQDGFWREGRRPFHPNEQQGCLEGDGPHREQSKRWPAEESRIRQGDCLEEQKHSCAQPKRVRCAGEVKNKLICQPDTNQQM